MPRSHYGITVRKGNSENFSPRGGSEPALIFVALMMSLCCKNERNQLCYANSYSFAPAQKEAKKERKKVCMYRSISIFK